MIPKNKKIGCQHKHNVKQTLEFKVICSIIIIWSRSPQAEIKESFQAPD